MTKLSSSDNTSTPRNPTAVIVGSGWAGLWTLYSLREAGFDVVAYEATNDVGGVWHYVNYPGCRNVGV